MGLREDYGPIVEGFLNKAVDKHLDGDAIKAKLHVEVDRLVDNQLEVLKHKLKAEVIDLIDGKDDIPS